MQIGAEKITEIAECELEACLARIQEKIGVKDGDVAGVYFTGEGKVRYDRAVKMLTDYIEAEVSFGSQT